MSRSVEGGKVELGVSGERAKIEHLPSAGEQGCRATNQTSLSQSIELLKPGILGVF
jgi:hypothetical protein